MTTSNPIGAEPLRRDGLMARTPLARKEEGYVLMTMKPRSRTLRPATIAFGFLALGIAGVVVWTVAGPAWKPPALPSPNGHDDLMRAARASTGQVPRRGKLEEAGDDELRAFVEANREALALLRVGLGRACRVPLAATIQDEIKAGALTVRGMRDLGRLLAAEGHLALRDGRDDDAMRAGLDLVRLGYEQGRGGLLDDHMVGIAIVTSGVDLFTRLAPRLDAARCREAACQLQAMDAGCEPAGEVLARERHFARTTSPWAVRIVMAIPGSPYAKLLKPAIQQAELADLRLAAQMRLLVADLAVHAYRREHGSAPSTLAELVPRDLAAVPADPFNRRSLAYRRDPSGAPLIYSVGPDRTDDGGSAIPGQVTDASRGDLLLTPR